MKYVDDFLKENIDLKYRSFIQGLVPNKDISYFYGVKNPITRECAKYLYKNNLYNDYLNELPHNYYEEFMIHGYIIEEIKDYDEAIKRLEEYFKYINNWSCCDCFKPKVFIKNKDKLIIKIKEWINNDYTYTKRYTIGLLMDLYLDSDYKIEYLDIVKKEGRAGDYYLNMMVAWYFATALAKQYKDAIKVLENNELPKWIHNKTIQKAIESNRINIDTKNYLRSLKRK